MIYNILQTGQVIAFSDSWANAVDIKDAMQKDYPNLRFDVEEVGHDHS